MDLFQSTGILKFSKDNRVVLEISHDIARYYRSFIPKTITWFAPKYRPHITIIRGKYESIQDLSKFGYSNGDRLEFEYSPYIEITPVYIWINAYSKEISKIRDLCGLKQYPFIFNSYHVTIANRKDKN